MNTPVNRHIHFAALDRQTESIRCGKLEEFGLTADNCMIKCRRCKNFINN